MAAAKDKTFSNDSLLSDEFLRQLIAVGEADLLVGIPTLNNAKTVGHVVQAVELGFCKYFPRERAVIVNADGGSRDGTEDAVRGAAAGDPRSVLAPPSLRTMHRVTTPYQGAPGTGNAMKTILAAADLVRAKACAVISPDLLSIRPGWMEGLLKPVFKEEFDLVTPLYLRPKFEGLLVSNLVYPMFRAAFGLRLREPMAGDFALSGKLASHLLEQGVAPEHATSCHPGIWVSARAIVGGFRVGQCFLGPRVRAERNSTSDLVATVGGVVRDLFRSLELEEAFWLGASASKPAPVFGFSDDVTPELHRVNRKRLTNLFRTGVVELQSILKSILSAETFDGLRFAADPAREPFSIPDELWVKTVYDFAGAFHRSVINRDHIMQALVPIYRGRVASFTLEHAGSDEDRMETAVENLCLVYEQLKPYWIEGWKLPR